MYFFAFLFALHIYKQTSAYHDGPAPTLNLDAPT